MSSSSANVFNTLKVSSTPNTSPFCECTSTELCMDCGELYTPDSDDNDYDRDDYTNTNCSVSRTASAYNTPVRSGDIAKIASEGRLDDLIALYQKGYNCMYGFAAACKANQTHVTDFLLDHYTPDVIALNTAVTYGCTSVVERMLREHPSSAVRTGAVDPTKTAIDYKRTDILPLLSAKV